MMTALAWVTLLIGTACFASFGYGMRSYFIKPERKTLPMYLVSEVGIAICLVQLGLLAYHGAWSGRLGVGALGGALALYGVSMALFWWAMRTVREHRLTFAYSQDTPRFLIEKGPYRYIRHPFYTAYTLCFLAVPLALGSWWLLLTTLFMFAVYRQSAMMEEQKFARSELAVQYGEYMMRTGCFVPRPRAWWR
jgi:protein-S-isoprenylcysteine O-methyltransferase Ste14